MKRCLVCSMHFDTKSINCPNCGWKPEVVDDFFAYAPEYSQEGGGFKKHYFSELAQLEKNNFWFCSRNKLISWALNRYYPDFHSLLEIGCGTGYVLSGISKAFPNAELHGSEIFTEGLKFSVERLPLVNFLQIDARNIPYYEEFDVLGAFDVLEHIKEDTIVLEQIFSSLKPQGLFFITVPQHMWLWSAVDDYACHVRRYSSSELHQKIESAGFKIIRSTSFVTTLLPAMMISRFFQRSSTENFDVTAELKIAPWMNSFFSKLLYLERALIKIGINLPIGGSRLVIARKISLK